MSPTDSINLLAILIVSGRQSGELLQQLRKSGFYFTQIDSSGGVVQEPTVCLMIGLNNSRMGLLLGLVRKYCQPVKEYVPTQINMQTAYSALPMIEAQVGGALIYTLNVERFEQI